MGCMSSREAKPYNRSYSMPIFHGSKRKNDSFHIVSLTSSTLDSLQLDLNQNSSDPIHFKPESETINVWDLMEGLEDHNPSLRPSPELFPAKSKSSAADHLDPQVISNFRKAMTELSPQHSALRNSPEEIPKFHGIVKARVAALEEKMDARRSFNSKSNLKIPSLRKPPPAGKGKVVLYSTSLRGVRNTYEDCCNVKAILQSYGVRIDERDFAMHGGFRDELSEILGSGMRIPKVFADGRFLGGAEEVEKMHENGELGEILKDCEKGGNGVGCESCGDYRFVLCEICYGSCKVFVEEEEEEEDEFGGFRRCVNCNENGLVRCVLCS